MGAYTCEFGVVHSMCRCPTPHAIKCDVPEEHRPVKETEGGFWTRRSDQIHRCALPQYEPGVKRLDRWKCGNCGIEWIVTGIEGDQRDGRTWLLWKKYESYKSGPFAPGTK